MFQLAPMQSPRTHICYSSTSGLLLQPLSVPLIFADANDEPDQISHMSCGEWAQPASVTAVRDGMVSFTSVEAVEFAAKEKGRFSSEACAGWKRLSESTLWISSWADFPKFAKDFCYTMMGICDDENEP
jgi:hypothetical protein